MTDEQADFLAVIGSLSDPELTAAVASYTKLDPDQLRTEELNSIGQGLARIHEINERGGIVYKGGPMMVATFWGRVKLELRQLICTNDKKYAGLRRDIVREGKGAQTVIISLVSAAVAKELGLTIAAAVPFVALALLAMLRVGKEAYCKGPV